MKINGKLIIKAVAAVGTALGATILAIQTKKGLDERAERSEPIDEENVVDVPEGDVVDADAEDNPDDGNEETEES